MECASCKADIPENSRFCDQCGAEAPARCPSCGGSNRPYAKFCSTCGRALTPAGRNPLVATSPPATSPQTPAPTSISAERRQLTVMFCDLVGSTALSARMDPEDLREVIRAYHRCVAETVARFGGFAAKYMGDGAIERESVDYLGAGWTFARRLPSLR